ncbi:hypothetical protein [Ascidiimonas sp. W6]|uniref:hypothetical protein n=1 Tax=Ascidiimonas meishanensis TaxID=3128903 RepID=UPI0030EF9A9C
MQELTNYIKYIALASAIINTIFFFKYAGGKAKYFFYSIWFIAITEFSYRFFYYNVFNEDISSSKIVANSYTLIQFSFYFIWYRYLLKNKVNKRLLLWFLGLFYVAFVLISFFLQDFSEITQSYVYTIGMIFLVVSIILYFMEILSSEFTLQFGKSVFFWFSLGLLLFHVPFMPFMFIAEYLNFNKSIPYSVVLFGLNFIMHGCFIFGVLWSKKKYNF